MTLPSAWRVTPLSAASDSAVTEITGSGISRFSMTRNLTNWSGTQGAGTTLASSGSSHAVSNNVLIDMGTAASAVGTMTHVGFFDAASAGNCWFYAQLAAPILLGAGIDLQIAAAQLVFVLGLTGGMTNFLCNKFMDKLLRGETYDYPATTYQAAFTAAPSNAGGGTEVGGGVGYARLALASSMAAISGTQAPGTTAASTGTSGRISNNDLRAFADPSGPWGDIGWTGFYDASSGGNLLWQHALAAAKTVGIGAPLTFQPDAIGMVVA